MITTDGIEITRETAKHKFGGDPMAEFLWQLSLDGGADEECGDTDWDCWFARFGKRILATDDRGFVWVAKYPSEAKAESAFAAHSEDYGTWLDDQEAEVW